MAGSEVALADTANPATNSVKVVTGPEQVVQTFYTWYMDCLVANQDPLADYPTVIAKYVSATLIKDIKRKLASPDGLDADYFIQAQDYSDSWIGAVSVSKIQVGANQAVAQLVLGRLGPELHRLTVRLTQEQGVWKIRSVVSQSR